MPLTVNSTDSCKNIFVILNYNQSYAQTIQLSIMNGDGSSIYSGSTPIFNLAPNSGPISYPIPLSDLSVSNGIIIVEAQLIVGGNTSTLDNQAVLVHCDIDCCLTKLTNELIDCACDCAKCASSLAKAQKIFLLLQSSDYAIVQANDSTTTSTKNGFIADAQSKYLKAKEVCDDSCGCNC